MRPLQVLSMCAILAALAACDSEAPSAPASSRGAPSPAPPPPPLTSTSATTPVQEVEIAGSSETAPLELASDRQRLPLARILEIAQAEVPGEVIEVDLDDDDDEVPEYEVTILTPEGRTIEIKLDAWRGTILEVEED